MVTTLPPPTPARSDAWRQRAWHPGPDDRWRRRQCQRRFCIDPSTEGDIQFDLQVGGTGGNGGGTWSTSIVNVTNSGTIVTYGADANGILAQSIGGGGGNGGKAGTSLCGGKSYKAGGNGDASGVQTTIGAIEANYTAKGGAAIGDYK